MGAGAGELIVGGIVMFAGLLGLGAAAILALALVLPAWAAALIVGGVALLLGLILLLLGRRHVGAQSLVPRRTLRSLREDADWAREQMR
jgi:tetrahydromethanopterin S-methyltransferase subunit C